MKSEKMEQTKGGGGGGGAGGRNSKTEGEIVNRRRFIYG